MNYKRLTAFGLILGMIGILIIFIDGIRLITKLRKNMKNSLMHLSDNILLRKRAIIETVVDGLKKICQIGHKRHRSQEGFIVNLISGLIAYSYLLKKPY